MLTCICPTCNARHPKRKTISNDTRDTELISAYVIDGLSQENAGARCGISKQRVEQIFRGIQMSESNIVQNLDKGALKLQDIKKKIDLLKRIQKTAKDYTQLRIGKIDVNNRTETISLAFEQLQEALKNYDNSSTNTNDTAN